MGIGTERNKLCYCGSRKKYKKCHFGREQEDPLKVSDVVQAEKAAKKKTCSHPAKLQCKGPIVRAHTVQRALLEQIAQSGEVYGIKHGVAELRRAGGRLEMRKLGLSAASTFTGFCAHHDKATFAPIEDHPVEPTKFNALLLACRALSRELYAKQAALTLSPIIRQSDRGRTNEEQVAIQKFAGEFTAGIDVGLRDLAYHKGQYDKILVSGDYSKVRGLAVELSALPEFMTSGGILPEYSFSSEVLQNLADTKTLEWISFSLISSKGKGLAVFSWLDDPPQRSCERLVTSFSSLPTNEQSDALTRFIFEFFENVYISPHWWDGLDVKSRSALTSRLYTAAHPAQVRDAGCLLDDGLRLVSYHVDQAIVL